MVRYLRRSLRLDPWCLHAAPVATIRKMPQVEAKRMQIQHIRKVARTFGIQTGKLDKLTLIRSIQRAEGNFDCFATAAGGVCDQTDCIWREDCFALAAKGRP